MESDGRNDVLRGFTAIVDPQVSAGTCRPWCRSSPTARSRSRRMQRDLEELPEIVEAFTVSGAADAVLRIAVQDVVHVERVLSRLRGLPYVQQTDTTMLLSSLVRRPLLTG
jgi:DNA-binding Lrp family transcriptional regulator